MLLPSLTKAINAYLRLDPESKQRLKNLRGKAITIEFLPFHFIFQCVFSEDSVELQADEWLQTDTKIRGTPLQMLGAMLTKDNRQRFFAEDLLIEGDATIAQQVIELFDELQIDWEEYLSRLVGDVPAYHVGRTLRDMKEWLHNTEKTLAQNINEYIHEEAGFLPVREALQDFFSEIDTLRMHVDRIEARFVRLRTSLETHPDDEAGP
jgi:ubiquinone biosynthesis protein UbiJ